MWTRPTSSASGCKKSGSSNIWYGDYRAQVGACRTGERRLKELVEKYGLETVKDFIEAWMDYGEQRAISAIRSIACRHLYL